MNNDQCLRVALIGQCLIQNGDSRGIAVLEEALDIGTNNLYVLSAICNQLSIEYYNRKDYDNSLYYDRWVLGIVRTLGDEFGEVRVFGNLSLTFLGMKEYSEALYYCEKHLEKSKKLNYKVGEGQAYFNLGTMYHNQAQECLDQDPYPDQFHFQRRATLREAIRYYEKSLRVMTELNLRDEKRIVRESLADTYYMLGNFNKAKTYHGEEPSRNLRS